MGYLYVMMGVIISSAVIPATLTLMWAGHNKWAATLTPPCGLACALIAWLVTASKTCGKLDVDWYVVLFLKFANFLKPRFGLKNPTEEPTLTGELVPALMTLCSLGT